MKLKQLESLLGDVQQFSDPKVRWVAFPSISLVAASASSTDALVSLWQAENTFEDVAGKVVADFGCGCGTLGIASALLGAEHTFGIDIDSESLEVASVNAEDMEIGGRKTCHTVFLVLVMHNNLMFIVYQVATQAVYSLHKTSTREHVKRTALQSFRARSAEVLCELRFDVPQMYKFHKKKEVDVAVDLWRFVPSRE
ncbi:hypothetical protein Taro_037668 [Colocasia esculenta]|uniref:Uncharacterized protein n=1 Tax=Colocasia esculenta TaxID=4460 RepID=A0A843W173_COLES|nr:hypothetical protein [Colocasia esculenta]